VCWRPLLRICRVGGPRFHTLTCYASICSYISLNVQCMLC
jgi:hypothetical protein